MTDFDPSAHTVEEVHDYLDDHPDETAAVLAAEQEGKNRSTLVAALSADPRKPHGDDEESESEVTSGSAPAPGEGWPDGEYPEEGHFGYISEEAEPK